jgi:hypothetical protein
MLWDVRFIREKDPSDINALKGAVLRCRMSSRPARTTRGSEGGSTADGRD